LVELLFSFYQFSTKPFTEGFMLWINRHVDLYIQFNPTQSDIVEGAV
jgi:hypothetical protein